MAQRCSGQCWHWPSNGRRWRWRFLKGHTRPDVPPGGVGLGEDAVLADALPGDRELVADPPGGDGPQCARVAGVQEQVGFADSGQVRARSLSQAVTRCLPGAASGMTWVESFTWDGSLVDSADTGAASRPRELRCTRLADLVNTLDPELVAAGFGMKPESVMFYLADHVDPSRLTRQLKRS